MSMTSNHQKIDQNSLQSDNIQNPSHKRGQNSERIINNSSSKGGGIPNQFLQNNASSASVYGNQHQSLKVLRHDKTNTEASANRRSAVGTNSTQQKINNSGQKLLNSNLSGAGI